MNNVQLIGNLARAVELRELGGNKVVGKTLLAVSRMHKGTRTGTDWIPITLWDRTAQSAARYLDKGSRVAIQGRLHGDYVPIKGQAEGEAKRSRLVLEVIVDRLRRRYGVHVDLSEPRVRYRETIRGNGNW